MTVRVRVEGLRELERKLAQLPKATGKNVLRRIARGALEPMRDDAIAKAPDNPTTPSPDLHSSITISEKRTRRVKKASTTRFVKGRFRADPSTGVSMAMGPGSGGGVLQYASFQEFGVAHHAAQPFMRPAWDAGAYRALDYVKEHLAAEIDKAAGRVARKAARARK